jgi:predicted MFS family arabinose efflux permease
VCRAGLRGLIGVLRNVANMRWSAPVQTTGSIMSLLAVLALVCFMSALSIRIVDPIVPAIARDLGVSTGAVALLASAFAFPYALAQPPLGLLGDALGKSRIIKWCLGGLVISLALGAVVTSYPLLFAARVVAGVTSGGIIPLSFAIIGDRFPIAERQVALSRVLMAMLTSALVGAIASAQIAEVFGWRAVMGATAALAALAFVCAIVTLPADPAPSAAAQTLDGIRATYRRIFANPLSIVSYAGVFTGGLVVFGLMPYVAVLLENSGAGGLREAGFVIASFGLGGVVYTLLARPLLASLGRTGLVRAGGIVAGASLAVYALTVPWLGQAAAFVVFGLGYYMVHNSLQATATELLPDARGAAVSLHAFSFFLGQAVGPVVYQIGLAGPGAVPTVFAAAIVLVLVAVWIAASLAKDARTQTV